MRTFGFLLGLAVASVWASAAPARDLYVSNTTGDDHADGLAETNLGQYRGPVQTLTKALRLATIGDHVILANTGQPYYESACLQGGKNSGYPNRPFLIEGNGATLNGTVPAPQRDWRFAFDNDIYTYPPRLKSYQVLFLHGGLATRHQPAPDTGTRPKLKPLEWTLLDGLIYFRTEPGRMPDYYQPAVAGRTAGLTLYQVENVVISNLVVTGFQLDGINLQDVRTPCTLSRITARANGRSGIAVCGASQALIDSCVLRDNGASQLHVEGPSDTHVTNTDFVGAAPKWQINTGRLNVDGRPAVEK